jgi:hypothetical protein
MESRNQAFDMRRSARIEQDFDTTALSLLCGFFKQYPVEGHSRFATASGLVFSLAADAF